MEERSRSLLIKRGKRRTGGRNNQGKITIRHRGGGHIRMIRELEREERSGVVTRIEWDSNRTGLIGEVQGYKKKVYKLLGGGIGGQTASMPQTIDHTNTAQLTLIKVARLKDVNVGGTVYKVGMRVGQTGKIGRAAGAQCTVIKQGEKKTTIRMPSGQIRELENGNVCTLGCVYARTADLSKAIAERRAELRNAGKNRRMGKRPRVRGVAMNPVDHPNGGASKVGIAKSRFGKLAK